MLGENYYNNNLNLINKMFMDYGRFIQGFSTEFEDFYLLNEERDNKIKITKAKLEAILRIREQLDKENDKEELEQHLKFFMDENKEHGIYTLIKTFIYDGEEQAYLFKDNEIQQIFFRKFNPYTDIYTKYDTYMNNLDCLGHLDSMSGGEQSTLYTNVAMKEYMCSKNNNLEIYKQFIYDDALKEYVEDYDINKKKIKDLVKQEMIHGKPKFNITTNKIELPENIRKEFDSLLNTPINLNIREIISDYIDSTIEDDLPEDKRANRLKMTVDIIMQNIDESYLSLAADYSETDIYFDCIEELKIDKYAIFTIGYDNNCVTQAVKIDDPAEIDNVRKEFIQLAANIKTAIAV